MILRTFCKLFWELKYRKFEPKRVLNPLLSGILVFRLRVSIFQLAAERVNEIEDLTTETVTSKKILEL